MTVFRRLGFALVALQLVLVSAPNRAAASTADDESTGELSAADAAGRPAAQWNVLVLLYERTEFDYTDATGTQRHFVSTIDKKTRHAAERVLRDFVRRDIPELTSGAMLPKLTLRRPKHPLTGLEAIGSGYWPTPAATAGDRGDRFDAVIVVWNPLGNDAATGTPLDVTFMAGLTPNMGTGQTYAAVILQAVTGWGNHNALKHEFGHSILSYFDAVGTSPQPTVQNHTEPDTYVHCGTGTAYVWQDETDEVEIPNSIYNNGSGFTHDYYSGTTALATDPTRCLGIPPATWASASPTGRAHRPPKDRR